MSICRPTRIAGQRRWMALAARVGSKPCRRAVEHGNGHCGQWRPAKVSNGNDLPRRECGKRMPARRGFSVSLNSIIDDAVAPAISPLNALYADSARVGSLIALKSCLILRARPGCDLSRMRASTLSRGVYLRTLRLFPVCGGWPTRQRGLVQMLWPRSAARLRMAGSLSGRSVHRGGCETIARRILRLPGASDAPNRVLWALSLPASGTIAGCDGRCILEQSFAAAPDGARVSSRALGRTERRDQRLRY